MNHIDFWNEYITRIGAGSGWAVFENGTLVHPEENDTAEDVLKRLSAALNGNSGAGSPYGDFCVTDVGNGHFVVSFDECCGLLIGHCEKYEIAETDSIAIAAGILCRNRRNKDADESKQIYIS